MPRTPALSAQPVFGGPVYFIRNVVYNAPTALKFMAKPAGSVVYHNTIIAENRNTQTFSNAHFRNNLFLGTDAPGRAIAAFPNATAYSTYDYDGYPPEPRRRRAIHLDRARRRASCATTNAGARDAQRFKTLAELAAATGQRRTASNWTTTSSRTCVRPTRPTPHAVYYCRRTSISG